MNFNFPLIVDFYIPSNLDTVKVNYVDTSGNQIISPEIERPGQEGQYTVTSKTIPGYNLVEPASGRFTVNIGREGVQHEVTFVYQEFIPEPGTCTWTIGSPRAGSRISDSVMDPNATGAIRADGVFDEERGIPTSDTLNLSLKAFVFASC